jgi:L-fucose isomerase-like protein
VAPGFDDLYFDERALLRRFDGLKYRRLHEIREITNQAKAYSDQDIRPELDQMKAQAKGAIPAALDMLATNARVYKAFRDFLDKNDYDALAVSCWPHFQQTFERPFSVCAVVGQLNDDGVATACEGDGLSAVSMLTLQYIARDTAMLMDLSAFDEQDGTVLMWHCGPAASCFAGKGGYTLGGNYSGTPHQKGRPPSCCGVARDMVFGPGPVTVARLAGEVDRMFLAEGDFIQGPKKSFHGSRGWMGNLSLNREPIAVRDFVNTVLARKFSHHFPIVKGDWGREVMELRGWLGLAAVERMPYQDFLQDG